MNKKLTFLVWAKINSVWAPLNIDIDPFVIVLDKKGDVAIAKKGNNIAEYRNGSIKESYRRAEKALFGERVKGGSKIYWKTGDQLRKRLFLGAIGVSGLKLERDHPFVRKFAGFRSASGIRLNDFFSDFKVSDDELIQYSKEEMENLSIRLPESEGVYLAKGIDGSEAWGEIDVYNHPIKGLCCFVYDYGGESSGVDDDTDCHVSVQFTGLTFGKKVKNLE